MSVKATSRLAYISQLRFPLAAMVVLIHCSMMKYIGTAAGAEETFRMLVHGLSVGLTSLAVPLFFAMSGYLFFHGTDRFTWGVYAEKLKRRLKTLLIPYLVWNAVALLVFWLKARLGHAPMQWPLSLDLWWGCREMVPESVNALGFSVGAMRGPLLLPMWFVRDLMLLALLSPLLHWLLKKAGWVVVLAVGAVWYAHLWPNWGGVSGTGLLFFSLGALFSIRGIDPLQVTRKCMLPASLLAAATLLAYDVLWEQVSGWVAQAINAIYVWSSMVVAIQLAERSSRNHPIPSWLSSSSFFVYAVHPLFCFVLLEPLSRLALQHGLFIMLVCYAACFVGVLSLSLLAFKVVRCIEQGHGVLTGIWSRRKSGA